MAVLRAHPPQCSAAKPRYTPETFMLRPPTLQRAISRVVATGHFATGRFAAPSRHARSYRARLPLALGGEAPLHPPVTWSHHDLVTSW